MNMQRSEWKKVCLTSLFSFLLISTTQRLLLLTTNTTALCFLTNQARKACHYYYYYLLLIKGKVKFWISRLTTLTQYLRERDREREREREWKWKLTLRVNKMTRFVVLNSRGLLSITNDFICRNNGGPIVKVALGVVDKSNTPLFIVSLVEVFCSHKMWFCLHSKQVQSRKRAWKPDAIVLSSIA